MYYILIETNLILPAWIDEMDPLSEELRSQMEDARLLLSTTLSLPVSLRSSSDGLMGSRSSSAEISVPSEVLIAQPSAVASSSRDLDLHMAAPSSAPSTEKKKSTFNVLESMAASSTPLPQATKKKLAFSTGNPSVETTNGIIHLFAEHPSGVTSATKTSKMVCIVAVPTWLSLADLAEFFGQNLVNKIEAIRVLADNSPNKYMVVLRFRLVEDAIHFIQELNGKPFSSMSETGSPELCHCAFVKYVDFIKPTGKSKVDSLASSTLFPYSTMSGPTLIEIPNCPVCLERLDTSVSGLLTILCNHTFHCSCLLQWKEDNTCPVCRYTQQPVGHESVCSKCGNHEGLWICLLCGHVGCSRYHESHAYTHYKDTLHNYALELASQRVWDYAGDGYVHRLIQNKSDGKLVEFPGLHSRSDAREESKEDLQKADAIYLEYQYLLTAQLETQRSWFEQKMREHEEIRSRHIRELEQQTKTLKDQLSKSQTRTKQLEAESEASLTLTFQKDKQIRELEDQLRDLMTHLDARRAVGQGELADGQVVMLPNNESRITSATSSTGPTTPTRDALRRKIAKRNGNKK